MISARVEDDMIDWNTLGPVRVSVMREGDRQWTAISTVGQFPLVSEHQMAPEPHQYYVLIDPLMLVTATPLMRQHLFEDAFNTLALMVYHGRVEV
jgi:hypothetical protein